MTHGFHVKLFLIQGGEVAIDNFGYRDSMYEFGLIIQVFVLFVFCIMCRFDTITSSAN